MGTRRVIVANSYDSVRELWLDNRSQNNSRPTLYTFHEVVSKTQGFTIGTTPWGDSYKKKKKFVATNLNKKAVEGLSGLLDDESIGCLKRISEMVKQDENHEVSLLKVTQGYHLRIALYITYGYWVDFKNEVGLHLLDEITTVENQITRLRSHTSNLQDYVPLLRLVSIKLNDDANVYRQRRDTYMKFLLDQLKKRLSTGENVDCFVAQAWQIMQEDNDKLNTAELKSACLTLVSAGLDNTPLNFFYLIGHLSQPEYGYEMQEIALNEINKEYGSLKEAWDKAPYENFKVDYIVAILKETLRHMTVLPLSLPRESTGDIFYKNSVIPKGTLLFMNAAAADYDPKYFPEPQRFEPKRWLNDNLKMTDTKLSHFAFGLGSRMCAGSHLAYKEMYVLLIRFLIRFKIKEPIDPSMKMVTDPFELNEIPTSIAIEPKPYLVNLEFRECTECWEEV